MSTIFALATARGRAGVAIVRISGPDAVNAASRLMGNVPALRGVRQLCDKDGAVLDEALVLRFPAGKSFTGEEVVELQLHGSPAVVSAVLRVLGEDPNLDPAEAGGFTRRALENGMLDLAQVEGLADLIDAETEQQRKQALQIFSGALGKLVDGWRRDLVRAVSLLEATIDFADEDVPVDVMPEVGMLVQTVRSEMQEHLDGAGAAERIRDGFEVAIIGKPNVGKSTLLNRLAGRDVAITSEVAGTTRDVIEVRMDLGGMATTLLDTAGLRETEDVVESIGVARARERAKMADLRVYILGLGEEIPENAGADDIFVYGKADERAVVSDGISGKTGVGVDALVARITERLETRVSGAGLATRERHKLALIDGCRELENVLYGFDDAGGLPELTAAHLWSAIRAIDSIVGRVDVEDVLDEIFQSFCIGK